MTHSEVKEKVRDFAIYHNADHQVLTNNKKRYYDIYLGKESLEIAVRIQFHTIAACKVDVVTEQLNYMMRKINDKLKEI